MSALRQRADMISVQIDVCFVPKADIPLQGHRANNLREYRCDVVGAVLRLDLNLTKPFRKIEHRGVAL